MTIASRANGLVKKFNTRNPFEIIKNLNVILVFYPLEGINGFYQYFQRNNIIYIDERLPYEMQCFVCAHELGHMLLHKKANAIFMDSRTLINTSKYEMEADRFAMNLLVSDDIFNDNLELSMSQLSRLIGYDERLIELRLKDFC